MSDPAPDNVFDLFTGQREREQVICTPPELVAVVDHTFGAGLWHDVYPCPGSPATTHSLPVPDGWDAHGEMAWPQNSFGNPPFCDFRTPLERAQLEHKRGRNVLILGPARTRRDWYCDAWISCTIQSFLKPVTFIDPKTGKPWRPINKKTGKPGPVSQFPENISMTLWTHSQAQAERFIEAVSPRANLVQDQR